MPGDFTVINGKTGVITAPVGVGAFGFDGTFSFTNKGAVAGANAAVYVSGFNDVSIENSGDLIAELNGLYFYFSTPGGSARIDNSGTIEGENTGIFSFTTQGARLAVHNEKGGMIEGGELHAAIDVSEQLVLRNDGKIKGHVVGGDFGDTVVNKGKLAGDLFLAAGNDKVTVAGKIKGDVSLGTGDDKLVLKDKGKATGLIDAGPGNDKVVFGKAADKFLFDSGLDAATNVTPSRTFIRARTQFFLDQDIFPTVTPGTLHASEFQGARKRRTPTDRIIYDKKSGSLFYDPDGTGTLAQTQFASLEKGTALKAVDFYRRRVQLPRLGARRGTPTGPRPASDAYIRRAPIPRRAPSAASWRWRRGSSSSSILPVWGRSGTPSKRGMTWTWRWNTDCPAGASLNWVTVMPSAP